jgi:redox-sensitive bicupin YhaK (pirin superfamily)
MAAATVSRVVGKVLSVQKKHIGAGFSAYRISGADLRMNPFMNIDHFYMDQPFFPPHPHAGFSAVTVSVSL